MGVVKQKRRLVLILVCVVLAMTGGFILEWRQEKMRGMAIVTNDTLTQALPPVVETAAPSADEPREEAPAEDSGKININTASAEQLQTLDGIGEALAGRILAYREEHGPFGVCEELMNVPGIGEKKYAAIEEFLRVE